MPDAMNLPPEVIPLGDPRLRRVSEPVTDVNAGDFIAARDRLHAALDAFRATHGFGRAIAAPQFGDARRYIAVNLDGISFTLVNPRITWRSDERFTLWDDCMSFPDLLVRVERHVSVTVEYTDEHGVACRMENLPSDIAELLQHELDHLDGVLAVDLAVDRDALVTRAAFNADPGYFAALVDRPGGQSSDTRPSLPG